MARAASAVRVGVLLLLAVTAWRVMNYRSFIEPGPDSGMYMSAAWHANNGRALYRDMVSGAPLVYALDGAALAIGDDGVNSVRSMERVFAVVGVAAFFAATMMAFGRFWLAGVASMLFLIHLYRLNVIEDGNVTEEYGTILLLVGIAGVIAASKWSGRKSLIGAAGAGCAFALAVLCKEPFVLIAPPWFVLLAWPRNGDRREAVRRAGAFLIGAATPALAFLGYLVAHGVLGTWIDSLATSVAYAAAGPDADAGQSLARLVQRLNTKMEPLLVALVTAAVGLVAATRRPFVRRYGALPLVVAASAAASLLAASLGGRYYGHYFLFFVPSFVLLGTSGVAFVTDLASASRRWSAAALAGGLLLLAPDFGALRTFAGNLARPARRWEGHWLSDVIRKNTAPDDLIWAPWKPLLYVEAHRLSPTKWQYVFDTHFTDTPRSTTAEKLARLRAELAAQPPRAIVVSPLAGSGPTRGPAEDFLLRAGLKDWVAANYESVMCSDDTPFDLLMRKGTVTATPRTSASVAMDVGLTALYKAADPEHAIACFRLALANSPAHYGANLQLAKAMDAAGHVAEANAQWRLMLRLAQAASDTVTLAEVLARLR